MDTIAKGTKHKVLIIDQNLCPRNHKCPAVKTCPVDVLSQEGLAAPTVDAEKCIKCGKCAEVCPTGALRMEDAST